MVMCFLARTCLEKRYFTRYADEDKDALLWQSDLIFRMFYLNLILKRPADLDNTQDVAGGP